MREYDIFISFADENEAYAVKLCEALQKEGIKAWCSAKNVGVAGNIYGEISHALHHTPFFLPLISKHYQRNWHRIEFENGCYNKAPQYIIPVAYEVTYKYIESNPMFALIRNIRLLEANNISISKLAKLIAARVKNPDTPPLSPKTLLMSFISFFLLNSRFLIGIVAAVLSLSLYKLLNVPPENHSQTNTTLIIEDTLNLVDSFKEVTELPEVEIDFDNPNIGKLKVINIIEDKTEEYLSKDYKGLLVLNFILYNKGNQDFDIAYIKVEAQRNDEDLYFNSKASTLLKISNTSQEPNIFAIEIPNEYQNAYYLYAIEPYFHCPKEKQVVLPLVFYQRKQNNYLLPDTSTEFVVHFITKQRTYALSKRLYFEEGALYSEY